MTTVNIKIVLAAIASVLCFAQASFPLPNEPALSETPNQPGQQQEKPWLRPPPRKAVETCIGKHEGDPCSFVNGQNVEQNGECRTGRENIFACRPHRNRQSEEGARADTTATESAPSPASTVSGQTATLKSEIEPLKPVGAPPVRQPQSSTVVPPPHEPVKLPESSAPLTTTEPLPFYANPYFFSGSCLAAALLCALAVWYGFYRNSTLPLRRLRKVTQQLAGGDLSARVGEGIAPRKDEVADLGRDVDRMAERIESLVSAHQRLIRDVSHELRSPLARLNVALELARQSAGAGHAAPFDRIERESDRLNELIGQLLMLTKLESESSMAKREDIDLCQLVNSIVQDADFEARSSSRRVVATVAEPLLLSGNRELLRQALENLVRNAVRYTETGTEVTVSLSTKVSAGRKWAHIEVRDHGPGVPESELIDIFRPFYRVGDSRERQSGGTGVGLAISDRAVRLHGGRVRALNAAGGGLVMEMDLSLL